MDDSQIHTLASYLEGEAGGEGATGMRAVANVIANRAAQNFGGYGADLVKQVEAPNQFQGRRAPSPESIAIAKELAAGQLPDITGGAIYYANPSASTAEWARRLNTSNAYQIGHHFFTSNVEGKPFHGPYDDQIARHNMPVAPLTSVAASSAPASHASAPTHFAQRDHRSRGLAYASQGEK